MDLVEIIEGIKPLDESAMKSAEKRMDSLVKPIGSLGRVEELAVKLAGISGDVFSSFAKKAIVIMCADNGVYAEGVSPAPQVVTLTQSANFMKKITGVGVLSGLSNSDLVVVDIGINSDVVSENFLNRKIRKGTGNVAKEPAMTREEALKAISVGFGKVKTLKEKGYSVVGTGEMGLANTTTSSLVIMAFAGCSAEEATGRGAGLSDELLEHKKQVVARAFDLHKPDKADPVGVLHKVGGLDIAGLVGVFLGGAYFRMPVVIDGLISAAAALVACKICPIAREFMVPSHMSEERGYSVAIETLGLKPYFNLGMRLGEGSGCPFSFLLIDAAERITKEMATFGEAEVEDKGITYTRDNSEE